MTRRNRQIAFLLVIGILLGIAAVTAVKLHASAPPAAVSAPAVMSDMCGDESDDCYLLIYTPGICEMVQKYGYWYYAFYCDQREAGRLMAGDAVFFYELPDASLQVDLFRLEGDHRIHMIRHMPPSAK